MFLRLYTGFHTFFSKIRRPARRVPLKKNVFVAIKDPENTITRCAARPGQQATGNGQRSERTAAIAFSPVLSLRASPQTGVAIRIPRPAAPAISRPVPHSRTCTERGTGDPSPTALYGRLPNAGRETRPLRRCTDVHRKRRADCPRYIVVRRVPNQGRCGHRPLRRCTDDYRMRDGKPVPYGVVRTCTEKGGQIARAAGPCPLVTGPCASPVSRLIVRAGDSGQAMLVPAGGA